MTYRELLELLKDMPQEYLDAPVVVFDVYDSEFIPVSHTWVNDDETDLLDSGQLVLELKGG